MMKGPVHEVLTVINVPPPHLSEGSFITVHRCRYTFFRNMRQFFVPKIFGVRASNFRRLLSGYLSVSMQKDMPG